MKKLLLSLTFVLFSFIAQTQEGYSEVVQVCVTSDDTDNVSPIHSSMLDTCKRACIRNKGVATGDWQTNNHDKIPPHCPRVGSYGAVCGCVPTLPTCKDLETSCISFFRDTSGINPCNMYGDTHNKKCLEKLDEVKKNVQVNTGPDRPLSWRYICSYFSNDAMKGLKMCH